MSTVEMDGPLKVKAWPNGNPHKPVNNRLFFFLFSRTRNSNKIGRNRRGRHSNEECWGEKAQGKANSSLLCPCFIVSEYVRVLYSGYTSIFVYYIALYSALRFE